MIGRLSGVVVATTRDEDPEAPLTLALAREGARVVAWPCVSFGEPRDPGAIESALARLDAFAWVAFTSSRAVLGVARLASWGAPGPRIAAVGEGTAAALRMHGWPVHVVAVGGGAEGLVRAMAAAGDLTGARVLFPASSMARPVLEQGLAALGADVHRVEAYRTVASPPDHAAVRADLAQGVDAVVFASPSAVWGLGESLGGGMARDLAGCASIAIGHTTADALSAAGVAPVVVADTPTVEGLVEACGRATQGRRGRT
ncbi:MAG: uroporphyrinogen-III synthase [Longimicrobiales bacterium]|nr:uroporphyrinogen-III synthase [Longimicrobiales bacterium]